MTDSQRTPNSSGEGHPVSTDQQSSKERYERNLRRLICALQDMYANRRAIGGSPLGQNDDHPASNPIQSVPCQHQDVADAVTGDKPSIPAPSPSATHSESPISADRSWMEVSHPAAQHERMAMRSLWGKMATRPVSLTVILHKCHEYYDFCDEADNAYGLVREFGEEKRMDEGMSRLAARVAIKAAELLHSWKDVSPSILAQVDQYTNEFRRAAPLTVPDALTRLEYMRQTVQGELAVRKFLYVPNHEDEFFRKSRLFGNAVYNAFPDARGDIENAGTALAARLNTACVFYLMRASEHGLREVARQMKVRIRHKATLVPLEHSDWNGVITAIKNRIAAVRPLPHGPKRQRKLEHFSDAADHCEFMRDIWRNTASHARKSYNRTEALAAMDRVKAFMQFLSASMKEK